MKANTGEVRTGNEVKYVRRKAPLTPDWHSCFDAHLYPGRMFELVVMERSEKKVGDVRVSVQSLSDHCKNTHDIASVWVNTLISHSHRQLQYC